RPCLPSLALCVVCTPRIGYGSAKVTRRRPSFRHFGEAIMNEDVFNVSVSKFLKKVGITSQREIEKAVRAAVASGRLKGHEALPAKMTLTVGGIDLTHTIDDNIELE